MKENNKLSVWKNKNLYGIIRYFGFSYLDSIYYNYKQNNERE